MKTPQEQKKIERMFKEKMNRWDKTSSSILICWAINNAVNSLSEADKTNVEHGWEFLRKQIKRRYPFFIELYKEWMIENMPKPPMSPQESEEIDVKADENRQERFVKEDKELPVVTDEF